MTINNKAYNLHKLLDIWFLTLKRKFVFMVLALTIFLNTGFFYCLKAHAEIFDGLSNNTFKITLYGTPINLAPAVNIQLSFSNPEVASLSTEPPEFKALNVHQLITASNPDTNTLSAVWDDMIPNNEATITFMLTPGTAKGFSTIKIDKVETARGLDITNSIISVIENPNIINTAGIITTGFGEFTLLDPGKLISPGKAAIAFRVKNIPGNIKATLNGEDVNFIDNELGIAVINLLSDNDQLDLNLSILEEDQSTTINLGKVKVDKGTSGLYPPHIRKATAINHLNYTDFEIEGRQFGVKRFGKDGTNIQIVPGARPITNDHLRSRRTRQLLNPTDCIPYGSYVNLSHSAGTTTKKISVVNHCGIQK